VSSVRVNFTEMYSLLLYKSSTLTAIPATPFYYPQNSYL
jgi:hypothetical protein